MKKGICQIISVVIAILVAGCTGAGIGEKVHETCPSDTLYTEEAALAIYDEQPEQALNIIDSAVIVDNLSEDRASFLRAYVFCRSCTNQRLDTAWQICETLMESDFVENPDNREIVLDLLVDITRKQHNYEQCLRWSTEKADLCRQQGEETEALRTEAEIGVLLTELGDTEKGLAKLNGVIATLDGQRHTDEMDACIIALKRKIQVLQELGREEEVIPLAERIIEIASDYRQHYNDYTDNSYRLLSTEEETRKYCDFYIAQAYGYLAHAYAMEGERSKVKSENAAAIKQSRHYLSLFEQSDYGRTLAGRKAIAPIWCLLGDYGKMLSTYDEWEKLMGDDTLNLDYAEMLHDRAVAAKAMGNPNAAADYWYRYSELGRLIDRQIHQSQAHEYAVRYKLQEERLNTEREQSARKRIALVAVSLGVVVLVVIVFVVLLIKQLRSIRQKNAVLSKEISERIEYEEKYLASIQNNEDRNSNSGIQNPDADLSAFSDRELFDYIRKIVFDENLHLDPQFGRDQLMERLQLSKDRIGAAFAQGSEYGNISNFLNDLRLIHSAKLLTEYPEMPIAEVALASGFSNRVVFSRNFKERFAMTPTEFRKKN